MLCNGRLAVINSRKRPQTCVLCFVTTTANGSTSVHNTTHTDSHTHNKFDSNFNGKQWASFRCQNYFIARIRKRKWLCLWSCKLFWRKLAVSFTDTQSVMVCRLSCYCHYHYNVKKCIHFPRRCRRRRCCVTFACRESLRRRKFWGVSASIVQTEGQKWRSTNLCVFIRHSNILYYLIQTHCLPFPINKLNISVFRMNEMNFDFDGDENSDVNRFAWCEREI